MKQALVLCGGKAKRLRPYSYSLPKASLPFLNLPLLSFPWFYLEQLGVSRFLLNSHLFPEKLEETVCFLSQPHQQTKLFVEEKPLGSAGTLNQLKKELKKTKEFIYINGDSLFFPSQIRRISDFESAFFKSSAEALFFVVPYKNISSKRALFCDKDFNLKFVGSKEDLLDYKKNNLQSSSLVFESASDLIKPILKKRASDNLLKLQNPAEVTPFFWTGLALFKSSLLDTLEKNTFDLFEDFITPLLKTHKIKVYVDPSAVLLLADDRASYLESTKFCLDCLFQFKETSKSLDINWNESSNQINRKSVKKILEDCFKRFDPSDSKIGLKNGRIWSKKLNYPLLLPKSVRGLEFLKLKGPAVIGGDACVFADTVFNNCILDSHITFKGELENELLIKPSLPLSKTQ